MNPLWRGLAVAVLGALIVGSPVPVGSADGEGAAVAIQVFQFKPTPVEVKAGTRVTWTNNDDITHTVTAGTPEGRSDQFNSSLAGKGASFAFTFDQPGTYPYFCNRHQSMRGEIRVK